MTRSGTGTAAARARPPTTAQAVGGEQTTGGRRLRIEIRRGHLIVATAAGERLLRIPLRATTSAVRDDP